MSLCIREESSFEALVFIIFIVGVVGVVSQSAATGAGTGGGGVKQFCIAVEWKNLVPFGIDSTNRSKGRREREGTETKLHYIRFNLLNKHQPETNSKTSNCSVHRAGGRESVAEQV